MSEIMVVFLVVLIIWLGIAGYFVYIHRNISKLDSKVADLEEKIKSGTKEK